MVSLFAMRATESRDGNVEPRTYVDLHPSFPPSTLSLHFGVPKGQPGPRSSLEKLSEDILGRIHGAEKNSFS